jgi:hypothetical protein
VSRFAFFPIDVEDFRSSVLLNPGKGIRTSGRSKNLREINDP